MPKYRVYLETTASTTVEVEADDREQAIDLALAEAHTTLCHQCASDVTLGDFDVEENAADGFDPVEVIEE